MSLNSFVLHVYDPECSPGPGLRSGVLNSIIWKYNLRDVVYEFLIMF